MLSKESGGGPKFDLPEELLEVLPSDPFEQLDVARKITSIALSTRVSALESEASFLQHQLSDRDAIIAGLESQLQSLDASLSDAADKLALAQEEKLEAFRKTLMRSLQEDDDNPKVLIDWVAHLDSGLMVYCAAGCCPHVSTATDDEATLPPTRTASMRSQFSDAGYSNVEDTETEVVRPRISQGLLLASQTSTPRLTPPGTPPSLSASVSPSRTPKPGSPRRHTVSFSTSRAFFDDKSSVSSSQFSSTSSLDSGSQSGKTRVDGKEFFRQVRNRLSYEQFGAFLANVKELNSHKQTKEETLQKADEIFGPDNKDLYAIFEGLITRNIQ
ncbi:UNVERIFIED_CONTAM: hypothetical protein Slati_2790900 [Sesamum latifolium]|uniref:At4g15545-like C-terminal domain-containing protein n=1 Tax=Sesamum latifolium TaxID=2727402 RepID=A0AAW2W1G1_9LAMI